MKIRVENLTKKYISFGAEIKALDGVSLKFGDAELVAVVGESGSGKTTLLNMLCGMDRPDSGSVFFDGDDLTRMSHDELSALRRGRVGVVYQFYNLIPELNVRDNITLPVELDGGEVDESYLSSIIDTVGLSGRERSFPSALSGGQQQRVAIARALFQRPSLILADEPTGNLDERTGAEILGLLCRMNEEMGITVITVTHSRAVADRARRVIRISEGRVVEDVIRDI